MLCSTSYSDATGRVSRAPEAECVKVAFRSAKRAVQNRWTADERAHRRQLAVLRQRELFQQLFGALEPQLAAS